MQHKVNHLIVVMGVSGCGKTLVGKHLSEQLQIPFVDGDDLHPQGNIEKMRAGIGLDDESRKPWLDAIRHRAEMSFVENRSLIVACSALKKTYRATLRQVSQPAWFVHLVGDKSLIRSRMAQRQGHFMPLELLDRQFEELEYPRGEPRVVCISVDQPKQAVLDDALEQLKSAMVSNSNSLMS